jgi:hypothetical protein
MFARQGPPVKLESRKEAKEGITEEGRTQGRNEGRERRQGGRKEARADLEPAVSIAHSMDELHPLLVA